MNDDATRQLDTTLTGEKSELGMDRDLTRRDFLNAVALGTGAVLLDTPALATQSSPSIIRKSRDSTTQPAVRSGYATAHDGTNIYFEVYGSGERVLLLGPYTAQVQSPAYPSPAGMSVEELRRAQRTYIDRFADQYRLIFIDYPGEPKMYTLSPAAVARDYLAIADAAGAHRFAYFGYSWGAVTGLQLAIRTDRLTALISGGFPMVSGPYKEMLTLCKTLGEATIKADESEGSAKKDGETYGNMQAQEIRGFLTFYEGMRGFSDRAVQGRITCPRLCFGGSADVEMLDGRVLCKIGQLIIDHRDEMQHLGWDVKLLDGKNHETAAAPELAAPLVRTWLDANWKA